MCESHVRYTRAKRGTYGTRLGSCSLQLWVARFGSISEPAEHHVPLLLRRRRPALCGRDGELDRGGVPQRSHHGARRHNTRRLAVKGVEGRLAAGAHDRVGEVEWVSRGDLRAERELVVRLRVASGAAGCARRFGRGGGNCGGNWRRALGPLLLHGRRMANGSWQACAAMYTDRSPIVL